MHSKNMERESQSFFAVVLAALGAVLVVSLVALYMSAPHAQDKPVMVQDSLYAEDRLGNSMRLDSTPCLNGMVLAHAVRLGIPDGYLKAMQAGLLFYEGKNYDACWVVGPDGVVYVVDESGDMSGIPMQVFQRRNGA